MKQESKFMIGLKRVAMKVGDVLAPIAVGIIPGLILGGSFIAIRDNKRVNNLEKWVHEHVRESNNNVAVLNRDIDNMNDFMDKTDSRIDELTRQNNLLLEKALQVTEGKAS